MGMCAAECMSQIYKHHVLQPYNSLTKQLQHCWVPCAPDVQTFDGIDVCGERLAEEIWAEVAKYPSLQKMSLIGHSMGGLLIRYAAGM